MASDPQGDAQMLQMLKTYMDAHWYREEGATAVEYGIMVALIAVVIIVTVTALGTRLDGVFATVRDSLPGGGGGTT
jgi:pilus assembly protein Flp/PilA